MRQSSESDAPVVKDAGSQERPSRRRFLALGLGAAASLAALAVGGSGKVQAADGDPVEMGVGNHAGSSTTSLTGDVPGNDALLTLINTSDAKGHGLVVEARGGFVPPSDPSGAGPSIAITGRGLNAGGTGPGSGHGVAGISGTGIGVFGAADSGGIGVRGSCPGSEPAVMALSGTFGPDTPDGGLALEVVGKAQFSTAGAGTIPRGVQAYQVANTAVTDKSHITVTFTGSPAGARIVWIKRKPGIGFVIQLSAVSAGKIPFTYFIIEPGA